jgi:hypothetical protein
VIQSVGQLPLTNPGGQPYDQSKTSTHMVVANYPMYLCSLKEDNIMKKILLDICYREFTKQSEVHLYDLQKEDPLI